MIMKQNGKQAKDEFSQKEIEEIEGKNIEDILANQKLVKKIKNSIYYEQSSFFFPYYFMKFQRYEYVLRKQINRQRVNQRKRNGDNIQEFLKKQCIIINEKKNDEQTRTIYVNKSNLRILNVFQKTPSLKEAQELRQKIEICFLKEKQRIFAFYEANYMNKSKIVFGRSKLSQNYISNDNKSISKKHALLFRSETTQKEDQSIIAFISCSKKSQIYNKLSHLSNELIKNIIDYIGVFQKYKYEIIDACSSNGTFFKMKNDLNLCQSQKEEIIMEREDNLKIRISYLKSLKLNHQYKSEEGLKNLQQWTNKIKNNTLNDKCIVLGKNYSQEQKIRAIAIKIKVFSNTFTFILTQPEKNIEIGNGDYHINLNMPNRKKESFGEIYFHSKTQKWKIKPTDENVWIRMEPKVPYGLSGTTVIRLAQEHYYQISVPQ